MRRMNTVNANTKQSCKLHETQGTSVVRKSTEFWRRLKGPTFRQQRQQERHHRVQNIQGVDMAMTTTPNGPLFPAVSILEC